MEQCARGAPGQSVPFVCALALLSAVVIAAPAGRRVELPAGTVVPVVLDESLSSKTAMSGDRFSATVKSGRDDADLPVGTRIEGIVRESIPSGDGKPGVLDLEFRRLVPTSGSPISIDGSLIALDGKSVKRSESGRLVAATDRSKDRLKFVGIGAGAGLLIAALTKTNTLTDILIGAGAGYLYNELKKDKPRDVNLKAGAELGVRLERAAALTTNAPRAPRTEEPADDRYYRPSATREPDLTRRTPAAAEELPGDDIGVMVDDREVVFGKEKPRMSGGVLLVPLEPVAKAARFDYAYDPTTRTISARNNTVRLTLGSRIAIVRGARKRVEASAQVLGSTVLVPSQFLAAAAAGSASWDPGSRTLILVTEPHDGR